jgi:DNA-damage-inducible protein J
MIAMSTMSVRLDDADKIGFYSFCDEIGLSANSVMKLFAKYVAKYRRIPFEIEADPFYSASNMEILRKNAAEMESGINKHEHDLIEA